MPTRPTVAAVESAERKLTDLLEKWSEVEREQKAESRKQ
jgi:hypothetical protein